MTIQDMIRGKLYKFMLDGTPWIIKFDKLVDNSLYSMGCHTHKSDSDRYYKSGMFTNDAMRISNIEPLMQEELTHSRNKHNLIEEEFDPIFSIF